MNEYIRQVIETEKFLSTNKVVTDNGIAWRRVSDGKPTHSLYHGTAGILLFYLEYYLTTEKNSALETARLAGDELLAFIQTKVSEGGFLSSGFYSGWPGYVYALNELYKVSRDERYREGAILALDGLTGQSSTLGNGIGWIEPIPFSDITGIEGEREVIDLSVGAAGAGIIYLYAYRQGLLSDLDLAIKTADRLLQVGQKTEDGLRWLMMVDMAFPFTAPNFAHGGAGVGYFLADLYRETRHQPYLDAAVSGAEYVKTRCVDQEQGFLVCHTEEQKPPSTFYLGVCHGPAGTGRLMYLLQQITQDKSYGLWIENNFNGLTSTGAPEARSKGLWQNYGQCCGDAGIGDYALYLYHATGNDRYLDYAKRTAAVVMAAAKSEHGVCWQTAEHRNRPDFLEAQTGYMQGAAGIASFLIHLSGVIENNPVKMILPETPFTYDG